MTNVVNITMSCFLSGNYLINKSIHSHLILLLILLTLWLLINTDVRNLYLILAMVITLAFKTKSLILFYIFFEFRIVPITLIIYLYGYQPEKIQASLYILMYTVVRSLPLLVALVVDLPVRVCLPYTLAFMVKTPMYMVHIWLPKAHVEAPVGGSMFLSGALLKLGSYGLVLFKPFMCLLVSFYISMRLVGSVVCSLICLRQGDMKKLVAYSSIVHMGVVSVGLFSGTEAGYTRRFVIVLGHGLCSPALFAIAYSIYQNTHSRMILNNALSFYYSYLLLGLVFLNIGVPPRLNIWSEVLFRVVTLSLRTWFFPCLITIFLLGLLYNLCFYTGLTHSRGMDVVNKRCLFSLQTIFLAYAAPLCLDLFVI